MESPGLPPSCVEHQDSHGNTEEAFEITRTPAAPMLGSGIWKCAQHGVWRSMFCFILFCFYWNILHCWYLVLTFPASMLDLCVFAL